MPKIIVNGCLGKLGLAVCGCAASLGSEVVAGIDINRDALHNAPYPVFRNWDECGADVSADVIVDCSAPAAIPAVLAYARQNRMAVVICTTGLEAELAKQIEQAAEEIPVLQSANMSLGVNLLVHLVQKAAKVLTEAGFDIEIVEKHHRQKKDAPSGTALMVAEAIQETLGNEYSYTFDRSERVEPRREKEIGIHAVRGGTIIGEHTILFAGEDEVISLSHQAQSKKLFAVGAVQAAAFLATQQKGLYTMQDLMVNL